MILNEKLFLNEKFGDMPNWLKSTLKYKAQVHRPTNVHKASRRNVKAYNIGNQIDYSSNSSDMFKPHKRPDRTVAEKDRFKEVPPDSNIVQVNTEYTSRDEQNKYGYYQDNEKYGLFNQLLEYGLDPANLTVIEEPIPTSVRDKHLKEPFLPVFLLSHDDSSGNVLQQIYIKGINDDEISQIIDSYDNKPLKRFPMKTLIDPNNCKKFAYIDTTDKNNWLDKDKLKSRDDYFKDLDYYDYINNKNGYIQYDNEGKIKTAEKSNYNDKRKDLYQIKHDKGNNLIQKVEETYNKVDSKLNTIIKYISWTDTTINLSIVETLKNIKDSLVLLKERLDDNDPSYLSTSNKKGYNNKDLIIDYGASRNLLNDTLRELKSLEKMVDRIQDEVSSEEDFVDLDWE